MSDETFLSWAVTDGSGRVTAVGPWAINGRHRAAEPIPDAKGQAEYTAGYAAESGQTVHVWIGGGVEARVGQTLDGLRTADATAVKS